MYLNSKINTIEDFEKYFFLLKLNSLQLSELANVIGKYQDYQREYYIFEKNNNDFVRDFNILLKSSNLNLKKLDTKEKVYYVEDIVNQEITKNNTYLNYLKSLLTDNLFVIDTFKKNLNSGKILKREFIEKLKNDNNKNKIEDIIIKIDELEKNFFNKEEKIKKIIMLEKQVINEFEIVLDKLYFIFNIDCKNIDIKSKYIFITDLLKNKNKLYDNLKNILINKINLFDNIDNLKLELDFDDIKKISEDGLNFLLERLRLYEMHKKDSRVHISFMFR